jgi:hypothetical protein
MKNVFAKLTQAKRPLILLGSGCRRALRHQPAGVDQLVLIGWDGRLFRLVYIPGLLEPRTKLAASFDKEGTRATGRI